MSTFEFSINLLVHFIPLIILLITMKIINVIKINNLTKANKIIHDTFFHGTRTKEGLIYNGCKITQCGFGLTKESLKKVHRNIK